MIPEIRQRLASQPFVPFAIHVADGREYRIPTPDHAHVFPSGRGISVYTDDDREFVLPALMLSGLAVDANHAFGVESKG